VNFTFGSFTVDRISIYRSFKEGLARIYEEMASFPLARPEFTTPLGAERLRLGGRVPKVEKPDIRQ
jgi:hypothetical protein